MHYKTIGLAVGLLLGVLAFFGIHLGGSGGVLGSIQPSGQVETNTTWYTNGLFGGSSQQFNVTATGSAVSPCFQTNIGGTNYKMVASSTSLVNGVSTGVVLLSAGTCP